MSGCGTPPDPHACTHSRNNSTGRELLMREIVTSGDVPGAPGPGEKSGEIRRDQERDVQEVKATHRYPMDFLGRDSCDDARTSIGRDSLSSHRVPQTYATPNASAIHAQKSTIYSSMIDLRVSDSCYFTGRKTSFGKKPEGALARHRPQRHPVNTTISKLSYAVNRIHAENSLFFELGKEFSSSDALETYRNDSGRRPSSDETPPSSVLGCWRDQTCRTLRTSVPVKSCS